MSKKSLHFKLDDTSVAEILEALPGVSLNFLVNELLFSMAEVMREQRTDIRKVMKDAANRTLERISDS